MRYLWSMRSEKDGHGAGFLEDLYSGAEGPGPLPTPPRVDRKKVADFVSCLNQATSGFDPAAVEARHAIPPELLERLKGTGVFGLMIPREYGGLGFSLSEYLMTIEALSGIDLSIALIPLAHTSIGIKGILLFGTEDQKKRYLPRAATGEMIFGYALTEPETGSDAQHIRTSARRGDDGHGYLLDGTKTFITNANYAGAFTVFAQMDPREPGFMGAFIVDRGWDGVSVGPDMPKMGLAASSTAAVMLRGVKVPGENLIGKPGEGFKIAMTILNYGRLGLGAGSAGGMARSLEDMSRRASSRKQFGAAIGDFDLVKEKLVHARVHGFAASSMTYLTAAMLERDPLANVAIESSHCKLYGTTRCWDTLYDAQQVAGGSGYLSTQPYEKRLRDFRVTTIFEGTTEIHSMYPALTALRAAAKAIKGLAPVGKLLYLRRLARPRLGAMARERVPELRSALQAAGTGEKMFRRLLVSGMRRYGAKIVEHELYLRRMTELSLCSFWLLATVWFLKARHEDGSYPREDLLSLGWLVEEAREAQERDGGMGRRASDLREGLVRKITSQEQATPRQ